MVSGTVYATLSIWGSIPKVGDPKGKHDQHFHAFERPLWSYSWEAQTSVGGLIELLLDPWREFGEKMSDTRRDGRTGDTQRWSSPVPRNRFGLGRIKERRATSLTLGQLGKGWHTDPRTRTGAGAWEQGKELSLHRTARAPEAAVELPGAQAKRFITVA